MLCWVRIRFWWQGFIFINKTPYRIYQHGVHEGRSNDFGGKPFRGANKGGARQLHVRAGLHSCRGLETHVINGCEDGLEEVRRELHSGAGQRKSKLEVESEWVKGTAWRGRGGSSVKWIFAANEQEQRCEATTTLEVMEEENNRNRQGAGSPI